MTDTKEIRERLDCPFCGLQLEEWGGDAMHHPGAVDCPLDDLVFENRDLGGWDNRRIDALQAENERLREEVDRFRRPSDRNLSTNDPIVPLPTFQPRHLLGLALLFREWCHQDLWGRPAEAELSARQVETAYSLIEAAEAKLKLAVDALEEIGREQSAKTALIAADRFQSIARTTLAKLTADQPEQPVGEDGEADAWRWIESRFADHPNDRDYGSDDLVDAFLAGRDALQSQPSSMVMVPREPTETMVRAALENGVGVQSIYRAMLDAHTKEQGR